MRGARSGFEIQSTHDADKAAAHLGGSSRDIDRGVRDGLKEGALMIGLPLAKSFAPGQRIRESLSAGATMRSAYLQVSLRKAPEAGLLEFGGTVSGTIEPRTALALAGNEFGPVAVVTTPRIYKGKHYLKKARDASVEPMSRHAQKVMARVFESNHLHVD
jgi:hypothetical protein